MDHSKILDKIRKCLALSKSSNANEAAIALRQAQALMRAHGLSEAEVEQADVKEAHARATRQALVNWEASLANLIARAFGCKVYTTTNWVLLPGSGLKKRRDFNYVGVGAAAEVAAYCFDVLVRQCMQARLAHIAAQPKSCKTITKTARGDEFARCWVIGAEKNVAAFSGSDLHTEMLDAYMKRKHHDMRMASPVNRAVGRNVRDDSSRQGYHAGRQARLDRAIGASAPVMQIGAD